MPQNYVTYSAKYEPPIFIRRAPEGGMLVTAEPFFMELGEIEDLVYEIKDELLTIPAPGSEPVEDFQEGVLAEIYVIEHIVLNDDSTTVVKAQWTINTTLIDGIKTAAVFHKTI